MKENNEEVWVPIEGFDNYKVSNHGRIFSLKTQKFLSTKPRKNRYSNVCLYLKNQPNVSKSKSVAVLVASHFNPDYTDGVKIIHADGDRSNNHVDNLYLIDWVSKEPRDTTVEYRDWAMQVKVVEWDETFRTVRELCDEIGGDLSSVYRVLRGEQNTHLGLTFEKVE